MQKVQAVSTREVSVGKPQRNKLRFPLQQLSLKVCRPDSVVFTLCSQLRAWCDNHFSLHDLYLLALLGEPKKTIK